MILMKYEEYKKLEKKYQNMDDEKWRNLSSKEKKEYDMYTFERFMRTSPFSPVRDEWKKQEHEDFHLIPDEENYYEDP